MQTKKFRTSLGECAVTAGEGALKARLPELKAGRRNFVVTDRKVLSAHREIFAAYFSNCDIFLLPVRERGKSEKNLFKILKKMSALGLKRDCRVFAVGGGAVGDVGALAAALYMRGVFLVQVPTTLLSQVDGAIGGKTAVNLGKIKNAIGCFYPAREVIADPLFLRTLPKREVKCGLGEVVKYAALCPAVFSALNYMEDAALSSIDFLSRLAADCAFFKIGVVEHDERDHGERQCLNLGHTTAHALELFYGLSHGESVLFGLLAETRIAEKRGVCVSSFAREFIELIKKALSVEPVRIPSFKKVKTALLSARADKKNLSDGMVRLSVPVSAGEWTILSLPFGEYVSEIEEIFREIFI